MKKALCQMMLVKRNLRIIGDQVDQFLLIFLVENQCVAMTNHDAQFEIIKATKAICISF